MNNNDINRNGSGYIDPTAGQALKNVIEEERRVVKTFDAIKSVAHSAGYEIEGVFVLKDKTGHKWRLRE